jgi:hypothetical protein
VKRLVVIILGSLVACQAFARGSGGEGTGGGFSAKIDEAAIRLRLEGGSLKKALLNYVNTLDVDQISNSGVRLLLKAIIANGALAKDIEIAQYTPTPGCRDSLDQSVNAAAAIGKPGTPICFDVVQLAEEYKGMDGEAAMIRLASLAFHEHIHHFQSPVVALKRNENEAYLISAYVELTAKFLAPPVLKWEPVANQDRIRLYGCMVSYNGSDLKTSPVYLSDLITNELIHNYDGVSSTYLKMTGSGIAGHVEIPERLTAVDIRGDRTEAKFGGGGEIHCDPPIQFEFAFAQFNKSRANPFSLISPKSPKSILSDDYCFIGDVQAAALALVTTLHGQTKIFDEDTIKVIAPARKIIERCDPNIETAIDAERGIR